jgi:hypothetical protein
VIFGEFHGKATLDLSGMRRTKNVRGGSSALFDPHHQHRADLAFAFELQAEQAFSGYMRSAFNQFLHVTF